MRGAEQTGPDQQVRDGYLIVQQTDHDRDQRQTDDRLEQRLPGLQPAALEQKPGGEGRRGHGGHSGRGGAAWIDGGGWHLGGLRQGNRVSVGAVIPTPVVLPAEATALVRRLRGDRWRSRVGVRASAATRPQNRIGAACRAIDAQALDPSAPGRDDEFVELSP